MRLTQEELKQIIKEEFNNLISEEEIDEKLFSALKDLGKGLLSKAKRKFSGMPDPGRSRGVGPWYVKYKEPQKQPAQPEDQEQETQPSTAIVRAPSTAVGEPKIPQADVERGTATATVQPRLALPSGEKTQQQQADIVGELPPADKIPLQLPAPELIGIADDYGSLQKSIDDTGYSNILKRVRWRFYESSPQLKNLSQELKNQYNSDIDTVLKYLVTTNRVLSNSTIVPKQKRMDESADRENVPSPQQINLEGFYIKNLINTTIKHFSNTINNKLIEFVITTLYDDGRIAISKRLYNKLLHTNDPRIRQVNNLEDLESIEEQKSKSYNNFYNNWKKYTGVKI